MSDLPEQPGDSPGEVNAGSAKVGILGASATIILRLAGSMTSQGGMKFLLSRAVGFFSTPVSLLAMVLADRAGYNGKAIGGWLNAAIDGATTKLGFDGMVEGPLTEVSKLEQEGYFKPFAPLLSLFKREQAVKNPAPEK